MNLEKKWQKKAKKARQTVWSKSETQSWEPRTLRIPGTPETTGSPRTPGPLYRLNFRTQTSPETLKLKHERNISSLNYIIKQSQTKAENYVYLSEVLLFTQLLTMIISGRSIPLLPYSYATVINRNDNRRHLIGYIWIEKDSQSS